VGSESEGEGRTSRVLLDLVTGAEPIRGQVRGADGVEHGFTGWLELIQLLERARLTWPATDGSG
jgi:hypothetical protein